MELRKPARTPSARSASTWSCISAISGEIDDAGARPDQRRDLVAQRLAAAGRHEHERVAAADDVLDDLPLAAPERVVAEDPAQHLARVARGVVRLARRGPARGFLGSVRCVRQRDRHAATVGARSDALAPHCPTCGQRRPVSGLSVTLIQVQARPG